MAEPRNARLTDARIIGSETRLLTFQIEEARPLGFIGGQYVIVNTGLPLPGAKLPSGLIRSCRPDTDQHRFQIAVKRIGTGPGSNFMHTLSVGSELTFSGPWGKFFPSDGEADQPTLVFATTPASRLPWDCSAAPDACRVVEHGRCMVHGGAGLFHPRIDPARAVTRRESDDANHWPAGPSSGPRGDRHGASTKNMCRKPTAAGFSFGRRSHTFSFVRGA